MSTPLIPDGRYEIVSVAHPSLVVDLYGGGRLGSIGGFVSHGGNNQRWTVRNLGDNQITLESVSTPRTFASVHSETYGVSPTGGTNPTYWTIRAVGLNQHEITTADGELAWHIGGHGQGVVITLDYLSHHAGPTARWTFISI